MRREPRFNSLLLEALREFSRRGYRSESQLSDWLVRLRVAIDHELPASDHVRRRLQQTLGSIFSRTIRRGIQERVPGVQPYTIARIEPSLRIELDQRIFAGVELIKLNRQSAVQKTLQRFSGWVTSIPPSGLVDGKMREAAVHISKPVRQLKYEQRRVEIDQGHKLSSAIAHVVAVQEGAIAAIWQDRGEHDKHYDARPDHLKRSGSLFFIRDSWANDQGLLRRGAVKYTDEIEQPAEYPFCSCKYQYITTPRDIPETMLTKAGREWLSAPAASV